MVRVYLFEDGKYKVIRDNSDYKAFGIYRNGERWQTMEDDVKYSKFFHAMLNKIDELEGN